MPAMASLKTYLKSKTKWKLFSLIMIGIVVIGTAASLLARVILIEDNPETRPRLAVIAPGDTVAGKALVQGAKLYVQHLNAQGGLSGRRLELLTANESPEGVQSVLRDKRVVGVVGHLDPGLLRQVAAQYHQAKLRVITPLPLVEPLPGVWGLGLNPQEESRFTANYARNIQKQRLMFVVRESDPAMDAYVEPFVDLYKRFETPVKAVLTLSSKPTDAEIQNVASTLADVDVGGVYLATGPETAARLVKAIRAIGNAIEIFGPSTLSRGDFLRKLREISGRDGKIMAHGIVTATPVLFDTANDQAQRFLSGYQRAFDASPDWVATLAYEAARLVSRKAEPAEPSSGLLGDLSFIDSSVQLPVQMGIYNGDRLISAPVQLLPIAKGANFNYIEALRQGRVLYVNDRFMFRTNVVYTGVVINEISKIDSKAQTAEIDLSIWFRYRGKFDPQDIEILNAVNPIKLDKPEEVIQADDIQYRRYRVRQTLRLNFTADKHSFSQNIAGVSFRHRTLNRNNLSYVVDVLSLPTGSKLFDDLQDRRVVKSGSNWLVDAAWLSQDLARERGDGAPQYVGMTGEQPMFSVITMGVLLKPESATARDIVAPEYFFYLAIFGILGIATALALDNRKMSRYWAAQSWLLRLIFWPALLMAVGNLVIDWAFGHLLLPSTRAIAAAYDSLWWLLAARLVDLAVRRFTWVPLEETTQRRVPNIMKFVVSLLIYGLALGGILSMVFDQSLTSLLATSGLLLTLVGLAIRDSIANVFSGIFLNVERPFMVGDIIKINNITGQVKDITWRTTRIQSNEGPMVSMANSKVSEAVTENYSSVPNGVEVMVKFYTPPEADQKVVFGIITEAIAKADSIISKDDPDYGPVVRYRGITNVNGRWVAEFSAGFRVAKMFKRGAAREEVWSCVREKFVDCGISLIPVEGESMPIVIGTAKMK